MKIAIIGAGVSGLVAARELAAEHDITVHEAADYIGGHTHTHDVEMDGRHYAVDTGFIVFNRRNYPRFNALMDRLGVASQESSMSFSVRCERTGLEYNGTNFDGLFAQRRNLVSPRFLGMLAEIIRFNREAPRLLHDEGPQPTLGAYLEQERYGAAFREHYLVPMGAAIWSTDPAAMMDFPARFFVRFLHNHGMLTIDDRPVWRTITGGSARYVEKLVAPFRERILLGRPIQSVRRVPGGILVKPRGQDAVRYDAIVLACHADQALGMLEDPTTPEREVLRALPYQANDAVLHTDTSLMPRSRRAWAAWNYHVRREDRGPVALTYNMNILQRLESSRPFLVTLNCGDDVAPSRIIKRLRYHHPLFTPASVAAQARHDEISSGRTFYCGAYWGNGFHEDGVASGEKVVVQVRALGEARCHEAA